MGIDNNDTVTNKNTVSSSLATGDSMRDPILYGNVRIITMHGTQDYYKDFDFRTSDHNVLMRTIDSASRHVLLGAAPGKSKVTYTSKDGSGAKFTIISEWCDLTAACRKQFLRNF